MVDLPKVAKSRYDRKAARCQTEPNALGCTAIVRGENPYEHCSSIDILLEKGMMHNMYQNKHFGDLPQPPEIPESPTPTLEDVELYILRDLGGLADFHNQYKEDFLWFGITERMTESMCLFYYTLKLNPEPMPHERFKPCRPTTFWEPRHIQWVETHEQFDYAVWRAANAILDVRLEKMRLEIQARLDQGETLESIPYLAPGCFPMGEVNIASDGDENERIGG